VVSLAYVDQLTRSRAIQPARADAIRATLERVDRIRSAQQRGAAAVVVQLDALATQVEVDSRAAAASGALAGGRDAARLRALAATLRERAAGLR
jgi:hypothetical protein